MSKTEDIYRDPESPRYLRPMSAYKSLRTLLALILPLSSLFGVYPQPSHASGSEEIYLATEVVAGATGSSIYSPVAYQGKLYFSAETPEYGRELYVFDGTSSSMVVDFIPGPGSGMYSSGGAIGVFNNKLLLIMDDGSTGYELYQFDGSTISLVLDAYPGPTNGFPSNFIEYGGKLYFGATVLVTTGYGFVWDYQSAPQQLSQVHAGYNLTYFYSPTVVGSDLYFVARTPGATPGIVKFDGTTFTQLPTTPTNPTSLYAFNGGLVYYAKDSDGFEPWFYDGSTQTKIADLNPGSADGLMFAQEILGSDLVFRARTNSAGFEMWRWDGTNPPTMISDLNAGAFSGHNGSFGVYSNVLYFLGDDGSSGTELWTYDGTTQTRAVVNNPIGTVNYANGSGGAALIGNTLYFAGTTAATGREIFAYGIKPAGFEASSVPQPVTLTLDANGGSGGTVVSTLQGVSNALPMGSSLSYGTRSFLGWDSDSSSATASFAGGSLLTLTQSQTLYAIWTAAASPSPFVPSPPEPVKIPKAKIEHIGKISSPISGGLLTINGSGLLGTSAAFIGMAPAQITEISDFSLTLEAPSLPSGVYDLTLVTEMGRITFVNAITYQDESGQSVTVEKQVTEDSFQIQGFQPGGSEMTREMVRQLALRVKGARPTSVHCLGQTMGPSVLKNDPELALARAVQTCRQLSKWFGIDDYKVDGINNLSVGPQFRSTVVTLRFED